ncbi:MAG: ribose 5-phosphate isomerase B [Syntrophomonas sp.]
MKVLIGCDHAGLDLKKEIIDSLTQEHHEVIDCGTYTSESVDYPDIAEDLAHKVLDEKIPGILICGTGIGVAIAANKIPGIRAALCQNNYGARLAREHNDANILAIGSRITAAAMAIEIVNTFLKTDFQAGRHQRRVEKINMLEKKCRERG